MPWEICWLVRREFTDVADDDSPFFPVFALDDGFKGLLFLSN
jgi:hypothetical protein